MSGHVWTGGRGGGITGHAVFGSILLDTAVTVVAACAFQARSTVLQKTKISSACFFLGLLYAHRLVGVRAARRLGCRRLPDRDDVVVVDVGRVEGRLRVGWIFAGDHFAHRLDEPAAGRVRFLCLGGVWRGRHRRLAQELHRLAPKLVHQGREQRSARSTLKGYHKNQKMSHIGNLYFLLLVFAINMRITKIKIKLDQRNTKISTY